MKVGDTGRFGELRITSDAPYPSLPGRSRTLKQNSVNVSYSLVEN